MPAKMDAAAIAELRKKRTFKQFQFRGLELDALLDMKNEELLPYLNSRARRKLNRGTGKKAQNLLKKLAKAKAACGPLDKPKPVKTHLRNMLVIPEMIGSQLAVYNGKKFIGVEVKDHMIGHYLGEFSITYRPVTHGRPGFKASDMARFVPLN